MVNRPGAFRLFVVFAAEKPNHKDGRDNTADKTDDSFVSK
ncbi:hypothetical protein BN133_533 [Cronobacter dublinensis 582]|nr:hypothetical protein BN133_533 [Cronobacter dublinensis 582]